jgi:hypothetical protein
MLNLERRDEVFPQTRMRDTFSGGAIATLLAKDSASFRDSTQDSVILVVVGTKREVASDFALKKVVDSARRVIDWVPNNRYYLITEAVVADSVMYILGSKAIADLGGSGRLRSLVVGHSNLGLTSGAESELVARFPKPYRVFYKTERLTPKGGSLGGGPVAIDVTAVTTRIGWARELPSG